MVCESNAPVRMDGASLSLAPITSAHTLYCPSHSCILLHSVSRPPLPSLLSSAPALSAVALPPPRPALPRPAPPRPAPPRPAPPRPASPRLPATTGTARPKFCSARTTTRRQSTFGRSAAFSPNCARGSRCGRATQARGWSEMRGGNYYTKQIATYLQQFLSFSGRALMKKSNYEKSVSQPPCFHA